MKFSNFPGRIVYLYQSVSKLIELKKLFLTICYQLNLFKLFKVKHNGLHLGGGDTRIEGFLNLDASFSSNCDVIAGIEKLKIMDKSVGNIYTSHLFEHIPRSKASLVLREWYRVLTPGGKLFISVPNFENLISIYLEHLGKYDDERSKELVDKVTGIIYGGQSNKYDFHFMGYSLPTLEKLLQNNGFRNIYTYSEDDLPFPNPSPALDAIIEGKKLSLNVVCSKCLE